MSLRSQIATMLIALSIALVVSTYAIQVWVVMPTFTKLELQAAERNVNRCYDSLMREIDTLSNIANDWASWDDTYQYVQDRNETFASVNLVDEAFSSTKFDLICIMDNARNVVWGEARDMETLEALDVPGLFELLSAEESPLNQLRDVNDRKEGVLLTSRGPLMVASRPIVTTKRQGPVRGFIMIGRFLNDNQIDSLAQRTHNKIEIWTIPDGSLSEHAASFARKCIEHSDKEIEIVDARTMHAYTVIRDINQQPALLLRISKDRDITSQGRIAAFIATACSLVGGALTLLAMWLVLQWRIVTPLQNMAHHALCVGKQDDLKARLDSTRVDEIGTLSNEFDKMVETLADSRKKVLDVAHRAGMAEIASEVLHNVGNAVNSANCSVEVLDERLGRSKLSGLERATSLLREQAPHASEFFGNDPRAPKLIDYLCNLNETLKQECIDNRAEVDRLRDTVRHIRDAIASQQTYAGRSDFRQDVDLASLIDEVVRINQELIRATEVQVTIEVPPLPELQLNKSKMTQVLVNLVRNAIQSMQSQSSDARKLCITAVCTDETGIEITVGDTGNGFDSDVQARLFTHGFTTKADGNGFGLHYCANAVREVGGHISALSPGLGQGATFRIHIPDVLPHAVQA